MTSQDRPGASKNSLETASKMPNLLCGAQFRVTAANPYEVAHHAFKVCPPPEELAAASSRVVNTGALHFVRISVCRHVLHSWMHQDMILRDFILAMISICQTKGFFERERHLSNKLVAAATVRRVTKTSRQYPSEQWFEFAPVQNLPVS